MFHNRIVPETKHTCENLIGETREQQCYCQRQATSHTSTVYKQYSWLFLVMQEHLRNDFAQVVIMVALCNRANHYIFAL